MFLMFLSIAGVFVTVVLVTDIYMTVKHGESMFDPPAVIIARSLMVNGDLPDQPQE